MTEHSLTFPVAYDSMGVLTDPLRVNGHPTTLWIGADGAIRKAAGGRSASKTIIQLALDGQAH